MNKFFYIVLLCAAMVSCHADRQYFPKSLPLQDVTIHRFDSALLNINESDIVSGVQNLYVEYPQFMPVFVEELLGADVADTMFLINSLPAFLNDTIYGFKQTNQLVKITFEDISSIKKQLNTAFARWKYVDEKIVLPQIYFIVSGFNASLFFFDDNIPYQAGQPMLIAVGLDMYLGSDYEYYNKVVYNYQKQTMRKECIAIDVVSACLFRAIPYTSSKSRLLDQMIYRGKIMYMLSQLFKEEPEYEVMGYSKEKWLWAKHNERDIWELMVKKKDLFKSESILITGYLNDGPFTSEISQDSPSRLGTWIGWQIVKSYMENNKDVSLMQLMQDGDAQHILETSRYKP